MGTSPERVGSYSNTTMGGSGPGLIRLRRYLGGRAGDHRHAHFVVARSPDRAPGHALRLDYCFASSGLASSVSRAWVDVDADGSDHKPCWVEIDDRT